MYPWAAILSMGRKVTPGRPNFLNFVWTPGSRTLQVESEHQGKGLKSGGRGIVLSANSLVTRRMARFNAIFVTFMSGRTLLPVANISCRDIPKAAKARSRRNAEMPPVLLKLNKSTTESRIRKLEEAFPPSPPHQKMQ